MLMLQRRQWPNRERERTNEQVVVRGKGSCLTSNWGILAILLATSADNGGIESYRVCEAKGGMRKWEFLTY